MPGPRDISGRLASAMMRNRVISSLLLFVVTLFFAWGLQGVELRTIFSDLLPKNHPFVQTYKDHPNFGNPLTVTVMIKAREGDIYNPATLQKYGISPVILIWRLALTTTKFSPLPLKRRVTPGPPRLA